MCVTTANSELDETIIGIWDITLPYVGYRHVLAYQNVVKNLSNEPNCMILHIPSLVPLSQDDLIDTSDDADFLKDWSRQLVPIPRQVGSNLLVQMGIYHVAILNDLDSISISSTLEQVPKEKRPNIDPMFFKFYSENFQDYSLLLACFNNLDASLASPIMVSYIPKRADEFWVPTLESHGKIPVPGETMRFHQKIIVGCSDQPTVMFDHHYLDHSHRKESLQAWFPEFAIGTQLTGEFKNGDVVVDYRNSRKVGQVIFKVIQKK